MTPETTWTLIAVGGFYIVTQATADLCGKMLGLLYAAMYLYVLQPPTTPAGPQAMEGEDGNV